MNVEVEQVIKGVLTSLPAVAAVAGILRGPSGARRRLESNIKLHDALPVDNGGRAIMAEWITQQVHNLRNFESEAKRDVQGAVISFLLTIVFGALAYWLYDIGTWWSYSLSTLPGVFALVGVTQVFEDAQLAQRDAKGKRVGG